MSSRLRYFFDLDRQLRIYLRFIIESIAIFAIYVLCFVISDALGQLSIAVHAFNAFIWIFAYKILGLHKDRLRFSSILSYLPIIRISVLSVLTLAIESLIFTGSLDIFWLLVYLLLSLNILVGLRVLVRQLIRREGNKARENILVYGTSDTAIDLVNAMAFGKKYNVVGFVSDTQSTEPLAGLPVIPLRDVEDFARVNLCKLVVIVSKSLTPEHQTEVLIKLDRLGLSVSYAPTMDRAFNYEVQLKAVKAEEVLGRASEIPFDTSVQTELNKKTVLVTGAGGSIGSEICRQILRYVPEKLLILESNELALYNLEQEISDLIAKARSKTKVYYHLGSVTDKTALSRIFNAQRIDIVYHAAAYKHVPLVENNVIAGIFNNVFGTKYVSEFAHRFRAEKFVLVSTDKAVRPTNVMGASKRLAELVIQDFSKSSETIFAMVRFGNVLGSSGSVIPKFKSQINAGGPITVTHEEITRYFMSIPEAAHLVMSAGTFATGGDLFLLDMGEPVKIVELAKSMVRQHGLQPVFASQIAKRQKRENEILIEFTGLRPGEKLYEELLVDGVAQKTPNPKIFKSYDALREELDLARVLQSLEEKIQDGSSDAIIRLLRELPLSYQPDTISKSPLNHDLDEDEEDGKPARESEEQCPSASIVKHHEGSPLIQKIIASRLGLAMLHRYFLLIRGMTLGGRILIQNDQGEILLVKHTYLPGWHLPGGGVDHGEDLHEAIVRETYEECGIKELRNLRLLELVHNKIISKRDHVALFSATTSENPEIKSKLEIKAAMFFPLENLPNDVDDFVINALCVMTSSGAVHESSTKNLNYFGDQV